ncbi:MAG TPA: alcohol dehydrogenase, partial [Agrobacterium sp.]|uniref:iron-containing alcohol dehydrogenase n=1 Tax=Rhizobium sp. TaxID=391 RepID=UPI000EC6769C|nr:alcohol dehydrogenase [Agrobacterium sp.]
MIINPFEFRTVPSIQVAWGGARRLGELLSVRFPERRAQLITDSGLMKAGLVAPVAEALSRSGFSVTIFDRVVADPPEQIVTECVASAKESGTYIVIGLGGGSSLDIAKLVAILLVSDQALADMYGIGNVRGMRLPLVLVPTTAGTGSEVTNISIITTGQTTKMGVVSPQLYADF